MHNCTVLLPSQCCRASCSPTSIHSSIPACLCPQIPAFLQPHIPAPDSLQSSIPLFFHPHIPPFLQPFIPTSHHSQVSSFRARTDELPLPILGHFQRLIPLGDTKLLSPAPAPCFCISPRTENCDFPTRLGAAVRQEFMGCSAPEDRCFPRCISWCWQWLLAGHSWACTPCPQHVLGLSTGINPVGKGRKCAASPGCSRERAEEGAEVGWMSRKTPCWCGVFQ